MDKSNIKPKETRSFKTDPEVWHKFKIHCAKLDVDLSEKLEEIIIKETKRGVK